MDRIKPTSVAEIDQARDAYFARDPDRPAARVVQRTRQPKEMVKAKTRLRTAAWRSQLDRRKAPESYTVAVAFLVASLRVAHSDELDPAVHPAFAAMLEDLIARGYDAMEVMAVVRRLCDADRAARKAAES